MDTFVDSSWYYLRFLNPQDDARMVDPERARLWMPVSQYIGGIEHAILHLLYARFICRVLKDLGLVDLEEPFERLFNQGMITRLNPATGKIEKMSKSRGNTVSPDELIARFGADTVRVYTLFIGPPEKESEWSEDGVLGASRFLNRVNDLCARAAALSRGRRRRRRCGGDAAAAARAPDDPKGDGGRRAVPLPHRRGGADGVPEGDRRRPRGGSETPEAIGGAVRTLVLLLHPIAPHLTEDWWAKLGGERSLLETRWPAFDPELATSPRVTLVVQVNGRVRGRLDLERGAARIRGGFARPRG